MVYGLSEDPWSFSTSPVERERYDRLLASLEGRRYGKLLEIGCSIGVLTGDLAGLAETVVAVDCSEAALARARERNAEHANVTFERRLLPWEFPDEWFDCIVLSEVAYFWSESDFAEARERIARHLSPGGDLVIAHFLPQPPEHRRGGDAVAEAFLADSRYERMRGERFDVYRIDVLRRAADASYFEMVYDMRDDPYASATSDHERLKYARIVAALGGRRYASVFEIGCSVGVLSIELAKHADAVLAVDISETAIKRARLRYAAIENVTFARMDVPHEFPDLRFDAIVLADVAYYWPDPDFALARDRIADALEPGGDLVLEHFLPQPVEHLRDGDAVHAAFLADERYVFVRAERFDLYRVDVLRRR
jgi:SAM-dependent methyltransferase